MAARSILCTQHTFKQKQVTNVTQNTSQHQCTTIPPKAPQETWVTE